jgi:hypothetical protein
MATEATDWPDWLPHGSREKWATSKAKAQSDARRRAHLLRLVRKGKTEAIITALQEDRATKHAA